MGLGSAVLPAKCHPLPVYLAAPLFSCLWLLACSPASGDESVDYLAQIKPLLKQRCYACHGGLKQEGSLRLDTVDLMRAGGDSGPAIKPGAAGDSLLVQRVAAEDVDERMPPEHEGEPLSPQQVEWVRQWIESGAPGPEAEQPEADPDDHWAFQFIERPPLPEPGADGWSQHPIDLFLARRHREQGLQPQAEAPRVLLIRRLYLDLIGLPPTPEEIRAFQDDTSEDWYEDLVERLLDDPRHGERWARHWMDIWRYSDWWGLGDQLRNSQKHIWHWRDWIVESLNSGVPYDEMIRQMLAADELYPEDLDKLRASGYLARNWYLFNRNQWMEETVEHVGKGFLGLTMNCAKCHDHKYDAIDQVDFYRMRAFFEPYHVRIDFVPGQTDTARDGIPRAFDGRLDDPTYRFVRGDEKNPDTSHVIEPGLPDILAFAELTIEPVELPPAAWQPGRRAWVLQAHLENARQRQVATEQELVQAESALEAAKADQQVLAEAARSLPTPSEAEPIVPLIEEDFEILDDSRWQRFGGDWHHQPGQLEQRQDGATQAALRLVANPPRDFEATIRFQIQGGSRWRSVGFSFDASQPDPTQPAGANDSEQNVYLSAVAGGSKLQASYQQGGSWVYPGGSAVHAMPVELERVYTLQIRVRDTLVNASLDGEPLIAWRSPVERRDGAMQLTTFDALAIIHSITVSPLAAEVELQVPAGDPPEKPRTLEAAERAVADAMLAVDVARKKVGVAQAELDSLEKRVAAIQSSRDAVADEALRTATEQAVLAERRVAVAKADQRLAEAELAVARATQDKQEAAQTEVTQARAAQQEAQAQLAVEVPSEATITAPVGAKWTPTRFLNSGQDDPIVEFPPISSGRRTALARWMTDRQNPLTARVAVNHLWTRHMGRPLVATVFDFGRNGALPTHPELLDWLAVEFIESGWSMKHLHRLIVTSQAYRMGSSVVGRESNVALDPDNTGWWRRVPIRQESQTIRDSILALAGTLDLSQGGPPVPTAEQATSTRRSLYFFHSNNERNLFLKTFDEALVKDCYRREQSIVPQQALALTNSALVLDSTRLIAARIGPPHCEEGEFIRTAFSVLLGIDASEAEVAAARRALGDWQQLPGATEESARANLIWALINHNDFVTLR